MDCFGSFHNVHYLLQRTLLELVTIQLLYILFECLCVEFLQLLMMTFILHKLTLKLVLRHFFDHLRTTQWDAVRKPLLRNYYKACARERTLSRIYLLFSLRPLSFCQQQVCRGRKTVLNLAEKDVTDVFFVEPHNEAKLRSIKKKYDKGDWGENTACC